MDQAALPTGIKESLELLEGFKVVGVTAKQVFKDGKLDMADLPVAFELLRKVSVIVDAVNGVDLVFGEAKDLKQDELLVLALKIQEIVSAIRAA